MPACIAPSASSAWLTELSDRIATGVDALSPRASREPPIRHTASSTSLYVTRRQPSPERSARNVRSGAAAAHCTSHSPAARAIGRSGSGDLRICDPPARRSISTDAGAKRRLVLSGDMPAGLYAPDLLPAAQEV